MFGRKDVVIAVAVLALGVAGVALAGVSSKSSSGATATKVTVSVLDGKLTLSPTSLPAGKVILVVSNKGKMTHGLAIMGTGFAPKQTAKIAVGKTATLTVTLTAGKYHLWDPVQSSMSHAKFITVNAPKASSGGTKTGGSSGGTVTMPSSGSGSSSGSTGGGTGGGGTMDPGMDGCDHM